MKETHSRQLELLTTEHCTLCECALDLCLSSGALGGWRLQTLDISEHDELYEQYAEMIPVLRCQERELRWPFDQHQLRGWLAACA